MRLTPRRRAAIAILLTWPIGFFLAGWIANLAFGLLLYARGSGHVGACGGVLGLPQQFAGCNGTYDPVLAVVELFGMLLVSGVLAVALARWVTWPIRAIGETVEQLGPTSLGMRLQVDGPHDETRRLAEAIDALLDRVADGYEAQRRFAANASHELRTPLATQRALIEVSLSSSLTPDQIELLSRQLLATNERNESLVEGLLVLAETERGLVTSSKQRLDLLTAAIVETLRPSAKQRRVEIDADTSPVEVLGEKPLLERLVTNLVQNAIKYNVDGGWVKVIAGPAGLLVSNSGLRVAPEQVTGLFEPFRRASGDRLDHGGGVGLGLTIARSVVAAHRGAIKASANRDGGMTVEVRFPRAT